jgi:N-acetylneuraminate synthase
MKIQNKTIDNESPTFVIAEIGMNHNGSYNNAIKLIDLAYKAGADCVKFQMRDLETLYSEEALNLSSSDLSTQYTLGLLKKFELTFKEFKDLHQYAEKKGLIFMCTPWDLVSVDKIDSLGVPCFKIASADLTNIELISHVISKKKPIILSTGMSTQEEIDITLSFLEKHNAEYALLHCNSTYPAPFKDINLNYLEKLKSYNSPVGYSGHERGVAISLAAIAKGAKIIEKHITLDRNMEGPDHSASLEYNDFKQLVDSIRQIELALGSSSDRKISQGELINRENLSKSIFAKNDIKKGTIFSKDLFVIKSPGQGLSPQYIDKILGLKALRNIKKGKALFKSDLIEEIKPKNRYSFTLKWGIPVRLHDINELLSVTSPDFVEFHMSYNDLDEDITNFLNDEYNCEYIVHAPELFENDHLLDLCTSDKQYRSQSITHLQRVINETKNLNNYFKKTIKPKIIVNCGGFKKDNFIKKDQRAVYYENLIDSFDKLDANDIEILPQTLAPFPWHFGGQRYQNLFMDPIEIIEFCKSTNTRICHDISHSYLACNTFNWNHIDYTKKLAPFTAHYHISDGSGTDGEGMQYGEGTIDFNKLLNVIKDRSSESTFIPEVWQGHKNNGEGFWFILDKLENKI